MIPSLRFDISRNGLIANWLGNYRPKKRHVVLLNSVNVIDRDFNGTRVVGVGILTECCKSKLAFVLGLFKNKSSPSIDALPTPYKTQK